MKILLVGGSGTITVPPENYGGIERAANWLAKGLLDLGHEVLVIAKTGSTVEGLAGEGDSEPEFVEAARRLEGQFDVIIDLSHDKLVPRSFPNVPQVSTFQVMTVGYPVNPVFISNAQRRHCGFSDAPVVYYGLDVDEYPYYDGDRDGYLLYLGSIIQEKRVDWVLELGRRLDIPVKIAGPCWQSEMFPFLEDLKERDLWMGDVGGERKLELIQRAGCLVHAPGAKGWQEAGAIVVLEALMCGTPVIASTNGCLPEYITDLHNGFCCESVDEMVEVFQWLDQITSFACRESVSDYFSKERMAKDYEQLAFRVLRGERWGSIHSQ